MVSFLATNGVNFGRHIVNKSQKAISLIVLKI
jgi:hypothetical protein